jgi:hypothetical protein
MERAVVQRYKASLGVALALSFFSISVASADPTPTPTPSVTADPYKVAMEQFKRDRDTFNASMRDREIKMREINLIFKNAVDKANQDARTALATASTPLQKTTITSARRNAIDAAINARDTAIASLGDMPTPPTEPMKPSRPMMGAEPKGKQRR